MIRLVLGVLAIGLCFGSCQSKSDIVRVIGSRPKDAGKKIELPRLFTIDVTRIHMFGRQRTENYHQLMAFDGLGNLYVLDSGQSRIWVFDPGGREIRSFGGPGQGPNEFFNPSMLFILDNEIYVLHAFGSEFKVLNLEGEFLTTKRAAFENPLGFFAAGGDIFLFSGKTDRTFTTLEFILRKFPGGRFDQGEILRTFDYPPGLGGPAYDFIWTNWLLVADSGEFYFPENNLENYAIIKYDRKGKPALIFGRKYEIRPYSQKAEELFHSSYGQDIKAGTRKFPSAPPVVRKMFRDEKKNVWIISGETSEDNEDPDFENAVDVFGPKGEWLSSLRSKILSKQCLCHGGKIYKISSVDPQTYEQTIEVYGLRY